MLEINGPEFPLKQKGWRSDSRRDCPITRRQSEIPWGIFPKLRGSCLAELDKSYSDNCPCEVSGTLPLHYEGQRADRASQGEERIKHLALEGGGHRLPPLHPSSPVLLPGSLSPSRSSSSGLFFAGLGCPQGGEGVGRKGGEKEQLCQHNPQRLCSCPPWPGCHPLPEDQSLGTMGTSFLRQDHRSGIPSPPFPFVLLQSTEPEGPQCQSRSTASFHRWGN